MFQNEQVFLNWKNLAPSKLDFLKNIEANWLLLYCGLIRGIKEVYNCHDDANTRI